MQKKFMHNARLLAMVAGGSLLACSFATSFDDLEGVDPSASENGKDAASEDTGTNGEADALPLGEAGSDADLVISEYFPEEGEYTYEATGTEAMTVEIWLVGTGSSGPRPENGTFAAQVLRNDATHWTFTAAVSPQHIDSYTFQANSLSLFEVAGSQATAWDLPTVNHVELAPTWTCDNPPARMLFRELDGSTPASSQVCQGILKNDKGANFNPYTLTATYEYVGEQDVTVEGVAVPTHHFVQTKTATGAGIETDGARSILTYDWYFRKTDGLPVKQTRSTTLRQFILFATRTNATETAGWQLKTLTPKPFAKDAGPEASLPDATIDSGIKDAAKGQ